MVSVMQGRLSNPDLQHFDKGKDDQNQRIIQS